MYTTSNFEASISVGEYLERYVDVPFFLEACKECPNYGRIWSCPPYDFNVESYWKQFQSLYLLAVKIVFEDKYREKKYSPEELRKVIEPVLQTEKQKLSETLFEKEKQYPGSVSLSAGSCGRCKNGCPRAVGKPCRHPETMRYSIESLGGNVGLTIEKLMGIRLEWVEEGRLPGHFVLVSGLLTR